MLSVNASKLYNGMKDIYIEDGYMHRGCTRFCQMEDILGFDNCKEIFKVIGELIDNKLVQKKECYGFAIELTVEEKKLLILENNLSVIWQEKAPCFHPNEYFGEVTEVLNHAN